MAYAFNLYRNWELEKRGTPSKRFKIETAPVESVLKIIEIVVDLAIILFVLIHFIMQGKE